ncbi:hypothetical protein EHI8A_116870 [Entamoeba histolytica HM-1:IMSS-B]|uniref:Ras-GEF domain-containing protein n=5 Tax=Entamoeba histolytica TaxID=5759 RepID=C4M0V8_ENTH1|nr:hypothetical protein EHI_100390 [Entamoeba histolytica HM-1:IMSS]EMH73758.1 hypothetical protein EHI8A_116870 [Entamoeba histolytica HM-1:IMSS-B]EMS14530.1 hypothetical protein KM1_087960 [Entamoeba histolytica HM-3:IMSS]ENY61363.1 hypothetical protein EHI7A_045710 [Entamoeba histolytica HM-1:IMSS-A]GAT94801.1 hypothetical protein CL6EHI_100390 [Entamoeba histolytica]EAL49732.1 hypothetical protein EHI_100390 [Entamoeba histolytica HM-1:IMSS]|eukprot:XP_655118.1 hypothetical protein EHI_100390 [Entamoeba histolytica HM-1:IMSS]
MTTLKQQITRNPFQKTTTKSIVPPLYTNLSVAQSLPCLGSLSSPIHSPYRSKSSRSSHQTLRTVTASIQENPQTPLITTPDQHTNCSLRKIPSKLSKVCRLFCNDDKRKKQSTSTDSEIFQIWKDILIDIKNDGKSKKWRQTWKNNNLVLFEDFIIDDLKFIREYVWCLPRVKREILACLVSCVKLGYIDDFLFQYYLLNNQNYKEASSFLQTLLDNSEYIFDSNGDPCYNEDGLIIQISPKKFFSVCLHEVLGSDDLITFFTESYPFFSDSLTILRWCFEYHKKIKKDFLNQIVNTENSMELTRLEKLILGVLSKKESLDEEIVSEIKHYFCTGMYSNSFTVSVIEILNNKVISETKKVSSITPSLKEEKKQKKSKSSDERRTEYIENINEVQDVNRENLFTIHPLIVAQQLIFFDSSMFNVIQPIQFYNCNNCCINKYISKLTSVKCLIQKHTTSLETFSFFLEVAKFCIALNDFNMGYIILEELLFLTKTNKDLSQLLSHEVEQQLTNSFALFSPVKRYDTYKNAIYSLLSTESFIPCIFILEKQWKKLNKKPLIENNLLNIASIKEHYQLIQLFIYALQNPYQLEQNVSFQFFFHSMFN